MPNTCYSVIQRLEADNSRLAKEAIILEEARQNNIEFFEGCRLALDAMVTFGVKQVPTHGGPDGQGLPWSAFRELVNNLASRQLTGHDARDAIELCLGASTQQQWNDWYRRILIKDLRCGVSEKTINNVVGKKFSYFSVPVFACQLAHDSANHEGKVSGEKLIEVKLDGVRVITIVYPNGRVDQFSRNGKELVNFPHIKDQMAKTVGHYQTPMVFDGEVMSSSFQDLMKQVHRKSDVKSDDAVLHLFDILSLEDFESGNCFEPQQLRSETLIGWHETNKDHLPNVQILSHELVDLDTEEGKQKFKEINQRAIDGGYEGIMIKDPDAHYECKRTTSWLKLKPFIEVSLKVVDVEEGTGRNLGRLGAVVCSGNDDDREILVNVGSGFTDLDRDVFWNSRRELLDQIVEVRADAVTRNQDGTYSLRFPRFLRFRGFEAGEKL